MKKTPLKNDLLSLIASLNDQLCFFLFAEQEMVRKLEDFSPAVSLMHTTDVFNKNEYADRIKIKIADVGGFQKKNRSFTFGSYFSTCYEVFSPFYDMALDLLDTCGTSNIIRGSNNKVEVKYYQSLSASGVVLPDEECIKTMTYMRLRRNHFIHNNNKINQEFHNILTNQGSDLNNYWGGRCRGLDFTKQDVKEFSETEAIDLINIIRIVLRRLDENLALNLSSQKVLQKIATENKLITPHPVYAKSSEIRARKLYRIAKMDYDMDYDANLVNNVIKHF